MGGGTPVGMPTVTPTKVTWTSTTGVYELYGTGFSASASGLTGTATRVTYSEGGIVVASADGVNLSAQQVLAISNSPSMVTALIQTFLPQDNIFKLSGANDIVKAGTGNDTVYGGGGKDTVVMDNGNFGGTKFTDFKITKAADGAVVLTDSKFTTTLYDVERIQFSDGVFALDNSGVTGQAYRLYQAAFDRAPDAGGLKFWVGNLDSGGGLNSAASSFINSAEFKSKYGNLNDTAFVDQLYKNVLGRAADKGGIEFWVSQLETHKLDRAGVLAGFSESGENVALVGPSIDNGVWLG